jgi:dTDP-4-dehydrorhamnose reductase
MKVLITGGSGLLGKSLKETKPVGVDIKSTWYTNFIDCDYQLDICNKSQVRYVFELVKPQLVIHCAAVGSVDYTENNSTEVAQVNIEGSLNIAKAANNYKAKFVYISSNAVFDGNDPPYTETSKRKPVNRYGLIKKKAEDEIMRLDDWLIIRPFLLYGWHYKNARPNWFTTIFNALLNSRQLRLVDDVYWQPTNAIDCAKAIWQLTEYKNDIFNIATDERVTLYEFARMIAKLWGYGDTELIKPIASSELEIAPRPTDTSYDLSKLHNLGIELLGIEKGLKNLQ